MSVGDKRREQRVKSSGGYAGYLKMKGDKPDTQRKPGGFVDDFSRIVIFFFLFCAFVVGYFIHSHTAEPRHQLKVSVERMLGGQYKASIEGKTTIGDSTTAVFRIRESYRPEVGVTEIFLSGKDRPPFTSLELLKLIRTAVRVKEMKHEDMYGHPTRHFYGMFTSGQQGGRNREGVYFEYWADFRNSDAVRLTLTTVLRGVSVSAVGDTLSRSIYFNVRFTR